VLAESAGAVLLVVGGLVPRGGPGVELGWLAGALAVACTAAATWLLRRRRRVLVVSLCAALVVLSVLLAVTPDPAAAATLVVPIMLGGQLGAFLLPGRQWRRLAGFATGLTAVAVLLTPADFDPPQMVASVALVGFGLALIGGLYAQVHDQATTDALTGADSRAVLARGLERAVEAARAGARTSLAVVDLDGLKELNDTAGHAAGDRALVEVVQGLRDGLAAADAVVRLGGDEFVVLFADRDGRAARRWLVAALDRSAHSWSFGVTQVRGDDTPAGVLERADEALYQHKARVVAQSSSGS
jgi:diguanylate cyclase (GGDEF)-like protein